MLARRLEEVVLRALGERPAVLVVGARQVGKSTLVQQLMARQAGTYLTLDDPAALSQARRDPTGFVAGLPRRAVIDEVQLAPELLRAIKRSIDEDRAPGRFLLTGSANVLTLPRVAESLAGRLTPLTLWPLSQGELTGRRETFVDRLLASDRPEWPPAPTDELIARVVRGGYPEPATTTVDARAWFASYVATMLTREVRELADIDGLAVLPPLIELLAARTGGLLNTTDLSRGTGIALTSLRRYLTLLEAMFLVRLVPAWTGNPVRRLAKAPKVMFVDSGLAAHLADLDAARLTASPTQFGPLLENFVFTELAKQASWHSRAVHLSHFRTHAGEEVDVVLETGRGVVGVEVKATATPTGEMFRGLRALAEAAGDRFLRGVLLYRGTSVLPFGEHLHAVPLAALWA